MAKTTEFSEIAHSGGQVRFSICVANDRVSYQVSYSGSRPVPMVLIGVYALPQGIAVAPYDLVRPVQPPIPGCYPVLICSDSHGYFGHRCPRCKGYWRSGHAPQVCPYCAAQAEPYQFMSDAQTRYVSHYCEVLTEALNAKTSGDVVIDMDEVADAAQRDGEKPAFYVSEEKQQHSFKCSACDEFNDVLGRFAHCSLCGTRNDAAVFADEIMPSIRSKLVGGASPEDCLRDAVSAFDSFAAQFAKALVDLVPLSPRREKRLVGKRFHNLEALQSTFVDVFDIDVMKGVHKDDFDFAQRMFLRRHIYEHNGGEVDERYLKESGDTTVRLKQRIRETPEDVHRLINLLLCMSRNLQFGFHELIPPLAEYIEAAERRRSRSRSR